MTRPVMVLWLLGMVSCGAKTPDPAPAVEVKATPITVFAAVSLTEAFSAAAEKVPQVRPTYSFAGSQQLVTQLTQGAPADVVATADEATMQRAADAGLVDTPATFARTTLVIAVRPGNPSKVVGLADLARPDLTVVLADPSVPAGRYARQALDVTGVKVNPRSLELDVRAALAKVTAGEADAAIVYTTDVRSSGGKADAVTFAEAAAPGLTVSYRIAVVRATAHRAAAEAFVVAATTSGGPVRHALLDAGFTT